MITFNLKKEWFYKIKSGIKTHEYRELKTYWVKRITCLHVNSTICFTEGYPRKDNQDKRVYAKISSIRVINGKYSDLNINRNVFDIEFKLLH